MAEQALKDPYNLQFMTLESAYREKELEQGLMDHLQKFLVELGEGFAFMGRQYPIEVEGEDHLIDCKIPRLGNTLSSFFLRH